MPDLSRRVFEPELMDDPDLDEREHEKALRGLERLNAASRTVPSVWRCIRHLADEARASGRTEPLRILDIATGGGEVAVGLWQRGQRDAKRRGGPGWDVAACDISERALDEARKKAEASGADLRFFCWNAHEDPLPDGYDVITSTLFLHHLPTADQATEVLAAAARATRRMVVVSDLRRDRIGWWLAVIACHLFSRSRVVHFDGPQSVRAAFTMDEARAMAEQAGMPGASVRPTWPRRWLLTWSRP